MRPGGSPFACAPPGLPGVRHVEPEQVWALETDVSNDILGSPSIWGGDTGSELATYGEGVITVMPVVVEKATPLRFRRWTPGCQMEKGFWNIPVPAAPEEFIPEVLLGPVVGFDERGYRLGYGGGYFDRTLELLRNQGRDFHVIGIALDEARLSSFEALPHDIPFNAMATQTTLIE